MSFIHDTIVGYFDPATLFPGRPLKPIRPLEEHVVEVLLAGYPPEVRERVEFVDGYFVFHWAPCHVKWMETIHQLGYTLAEQEQCVAAESPFYLIMYPESAQETQRIAADALTTKKSSEAETTAPADQPRD